MKARGSTVAARGGRRTAAGGRGRTGSVVLRQGTSPAQPGFGISCPKYVGFGTVVSHEKINTLADFT